MKDLEKFEKPDIECWPDVRWWLAEGFHTDLTLRNEIKTLHNAGFGALEFLAMEEPGADSKLYGWGSEEWVHDSHVIAEEATKHGMGVSMTSGTNWSNANLITICPDDISASKELDYAQELINAGNTKDGEILQSVLTMPGVTKQELIAVIAARIIGKEGEKTLLDKKTIDLTSFVNNNFLSWTAPNDGDYLLFYFWIHGTGQTAEPSMSTSYTINYIDKYGVEAFIDYWDNTVFTPELISYIEKNGRAMMYMDSLELATFGKGGQFWGYHFLEEFEIRRGYDLTPYLPFVVKNSGMMTPLYIYHYDCIDDTFTAKLHNDLYQTMTDLYMENMLKPMQEWLHGHNMTLRAEISYGLPFEISQPGKYVDGIETESLEFASQIESYRNLAGPAHIYKKMYSSETGATLLNYMMGLDFYTQIIFTQFAAGVTKTVLHGYSSIAGSDTSTCWPGHEGMWPIFSERFGTRQPSFKHYNEWTAMISRYQMLLRKGKPRMDLGILRLDYNFNNMIFAGSDEQDVYEKQLMRGNEGIYWKDMKLQNAGYTWDYFAPQILEEDFVSFDNNELLSEGPGYQALIIYQEEMPVNTAEKLLLLAKKGLPIVFVNSVTETIRPGGLTKSHKKAASMTPFNDDQDARLEQIISDIKSFSNVKETDIQSETKELLQELGVYPRTAFEASNKNILTNVRKDDDTLFVYVYNMQYTETQPFAFSMKVQGAGTPFVIDCCNAEVKECGCYKIENGCTILTLSLAPGEARIYEIQLNDSADTLHAVHANTAELYKKEGSFEAVVFESGEYVIEFSDGTSKLFTTKVPDNIELPVWKLEIEDWNEGDKKVITEDRGLGIVTNEVYYETRKDIIQIGETTLKPWKDIPGAGPDISGIGHYTAKISIPDNWTENNGAVLKIGTLNKNTAAVYINGIKARALDLDSLKVDISELLKIGENEIKVEVSSTLNNRLLARGYYEKGKAYSMMLAANANNAMAGDTETEESDGSSLDPGMLFNIKAEVKGYGMTGNVSLLTYTRVKIERGNDSL